MKSRVKPVQPTEIKDKKIFGLSLEDVKTISEQIFIQTDSNHPRFIDSDSGFLDILENGKAELSASSIFVQKVID
jgi:hypothetical protein